jgi:hypothetical protein
MVKIEVMKCWFNVYSNTVVLDVLLSTTALGIKPISFSIDVPEAVLAILRCTAIFTPGIVESDELAGDWTGQTWTITLSTTT